MDPGLRQWAQPEKMQGNEQRTGTYPRASHGSSRPRTALQLLITAEQVNGKMLQTFRHLLQCNRFAMPAAARNSS